MRAYGTCMPARIPVAYASVYPAYGSVYPAYGPNVTFQSRIHEFKRTHDSKMFDFLAPGNPRPLDDLDSRQQAHGQQGPWTTIASLFAELFDWFPFILSFVYLSLFSTETHKFSTNRSDKRTHCSNGKEVKHWKALTSEVHAQPMRNPCAT